MERPSNKEQIKILILETVAKEKPENTEQLEKILQQQRGISPESTTQLLIELKNEGKLHFIKPEPKPASAMDYIFSRKGLWYWGIIAISIATTVSVFTIPETTYPISYVRNVLGIIFVLFLPGFAFIKALFPSTVPIKTTSENLDNIERIALGFGMSLALVPIVGLILNYTPWGIRLAPITLSLLALTIICATAAIFREYQNTTEFVNKTSPSNQVEDEKPLMTKPQTVIMEPIMEKKVPILKAAKISVQTAINHS